MKHRALSFIAGSVFCFLAANILIGSILAFLFPDFFSVDLLLSPGTLIFTVPLAPLLYIGVKGFEPYFDDSNEEIYDNMEEVDPDLGN